MHRDYLLLLLFTGLRRAAAARLQWSQIDLDQKVITIPPEESKSHREQRLPMSDFLFDLLKRCYDDRTSEYLFPRRYVRNPKRYMAYLDNSLEIVRRESGCNFSFHDARRTFLTVADRLGLPLSILKALANHGRSRDVTMGYLVVEVERLREPMQMIADKLVELMGASKGGPSEDEILAVDIRRVQQRYGRLTARRK